MKPDLITFKTNFNVTFGVCICFDLMFAEPAVNLINQGVKHFVYPTMWFSELPYLSGECYMNKSGTETNFIDEKFQINGLKSIFLYSTLQQHNSNRVGHMRMMSLYWRQMRI